MPNKKISPLTLLALMGIMTVLEVKEVSGTELSVRQLYRIKSGESPISELQSEIDLDLIKSLGLKICECCGIRIVPTKPIRYQILTRLCEPCWSSDFGEEDYNVTL